jgi:hypothetical protein
VGLFGARLIDGQSVDLDGLPIRLKVNPRARRLSLRIDPRTGEAVATAPSVRSLKDAVRFAGAHRAWLARRLAVRRQTPPLAGEGTLSVFGETWRLELGGGRPRFESGVLLGCGDDAVDPQLVQRALRAAALTWFATRVAAHCAQLAVATPTVAVTDTRSRWGSCSRATMGGRPKIRLSWRLALAPPEVADYVAAHECAHLLEGNHGPRFWALVKGLIGDPAPHRNYLRCNGPALHAFGRDHV